MKTKEYISEWSLEGKIGQLFLLAFPGNNINVIGDLISKYNISGCYLSQDNAETFDEARKLCTQLQMLSRTHASSLPMILGVDQEGAWGILIPESTIGVGNAALGALGEVSLTEEMYSIYAKEMGYAGFNTLLAPCVDILSNPNNPIIDSRAFGISAEVICPHVRGAIKGIKKEGLLSTVKHFPGHGDTHVDSHRDIPVVMKDEQTLFKEDLQPFKEGIDAGVDIVMTAHILYPHIDKKNPATLSKKILTDILRHKLNFKGLILSDSMNMGAIRKHYDPGIAAVKSLKAGVDIIMLSEEHYDHDNGYLERQIHILETVKQAVKNGIISEEELHSKLNRIIEYKQKKLLPLQHEDFKFDKNIHKSRESFIAKKSIQILKNQNALYPFKNKNNLLFINCTPVHAYNNIYNERGIGPNQKISCFEYFREELILCGIDSKNIKNFENNIESKKNDYICVVVEDYPLPGEDFEKNEQEKNLQLLLQTFNDKVVLISFRTPYYAEKYQKITTHLCAFSSREASARAMARKITL